MFLVAGHPFWGKVAKLSSDKRKLLSIFFTISGLLLIVYSASSIYKIYLEKNKNKIPKIFQQENFQKTETLYEAQLFPVRLKIPKINVDARVEYVGVTSDGEMEVPQDTNDVGWFKLGTLPGQNGSAVIAGHVDGENGKKGVFTQLHKLNTGDRLYIEDEKGISASFVVREKRTYDPGYEQDVFAPNDTAHLNLITCDGTWDEDKKTYSKRLVVFADIIN